MPELSGFVVFMKTKKLALYQKSDILSDKSREEE